MCFCRTAGDTTTGAIITTISTDMFHHCGPRVVFWADDQHRHGLGVGVGEEERQQVLVPGEDQHQQEGRDQARSATSGSAMVKKTRNFEAPSISALSSRSSGMPAKKSRVSQTTIGRLTAV